MGSVYLVYDLRLKKYWAMKEIRKRQGEEFREGDVLKNLEHPALPKIIDVLEGEEVIYLVMDYSKGRTLADVKTETGSISKRHLLNWGIQICQVLTYLHQQSPPIIYRDMKPSNILLEKSGRIKLLDFGIVKITANAVEDSMAYQGTKGYAAPEQYEGKADVRTDIYGLGAALGILLEQKDKDLKKIFEKCQKEKPEQRYASTNELEKAFRQLQKKKSINEIFFLIGIVLIGIGMLFLIGEKLRIKNETQQFYQIMQEANQQKELAPSFYEKAIHLKPEQEEAYRALLARYVQNGEINNGIECTMHWLTSYPEETKGMQEIWMDMGMLYFQGSVLDPTFSIDYQKAKECFDQIQQGKEEASIYANIAGAFSSWSQEIEWSEVVKAMSELEAILDRKEERLEKVEGYFTLACLYFTYEKEIKEDKENIWNKGIGLLEKAEEIIKGCKQEILTPVYSIECKLRLAKAYEQKNNFPRSILYYQAAMAYPLTRQQKVGISLEIAALYREEKEYEKAESCYQNLIQEYPEEIDSYCAYAMMLLMELQEEEQARGVLQRIEQMTEKEHNRNYKILEKRLKELEES